MYWKSCKREDQFSSRGALILLLKRNSGNGKVEKEKIAKNSSVSYNLLDLLSLHYNYLNTSSIINTYHTNTQPHTGTKTLFKTALNKTSFTLESQSPESPSSLVSSHFFLLVGSIFVLILSLFFP